MSHVLMYNVHIPLQSCLLLYSFCHLLTSGYICGDIYGKWWAIVLTGKQYDCKNCICICLHKPMINKRRSTFNDITAVGVCKYIILSIYHSHTFCCTMYIKANVDISLEQTIEHGFA